MDVLTLGRGRSQRAAPLRREIDASPSVVRWRNAYVAGRTVRTVRARPRQLTLHRRPGQFVKIRLPISCARARVCMRPASRLRVSQSARRSCVTRIPQVGPRPRRRAAIAVDSMHRRQAPSDRCRRAVGSDTTWRSVRRIAFLANRRVALCTDLTDRLRDVRSQNETRQLRDCRSNGAAEPPVGTRLAVGDRSSHLLPERIAAPAQRRSPRSADVEFRDHGDYGCATKPPSDAPLSNPLAIVAAAP